MRNSIRLRLPAATPGDVRPSLPPPNPDTGLPTGLRGLPVLPPSLPGDPPRPLFFGAFRRLGRFQLGVGPLFTHLPVSLHLLAKLTTRLDLTAQHRDLLGGHVARAGLAARR